MADELEDFLLIKRHMSDRRLRKLKELDAPKPVIENEEKLLAKRIAACLAAGVPEEHYTEFCKVADLKMDMFDVESTYHDKCLTYFRFQQGLDKAKIEGPPPGTNGACDLPESQQCSPFCPKYIQATEAQVTAFFHGIDVDTGEEIPMDEDLENLLDEAKDE